MNITLIQENGITASDLPKPGNDQMQNEYNYILAEQMTRRLLEGGLISADEFNKIMAKNRLTFSPFLAKIIPETA